MRNMRKNAVMVVVMALAGMACGGGMPSMDGLHEACAGAQATCAYGQDCMTYHGLAGQPLSSCEIPCAVDKDCPGGLTCVTVTVDGPTEPHCQ